MAGSWILFTKTPAWSRLRRWPSREEIEQRALERFGVAAAIGGGGRGGQTVAQGAGHVALVDEKTGDGDRGVEGLAGGGTGRGKEFRGGQGAGVEQFADGGSAGFFEAGEFGFAVGGANKDVGQRRFGRLGGGEAIQFAGARKLLLAGGLAQEVGGAGMILADEFEAGFANGPATVTGGLEDASVHGPEMRGHKPRGHRQDQAGRGAQRR